MGRSVLTLLLLWLGHYLIDFMIGIWAVYKTLAGLDLAVAGMIAGFAAMAGEGMQILYGVLSDRGHRRLLIMSGLAASSASAFLAYTENYALLSLLFLFCCLGSGAFHPSAAGLVAALSKRQKGFYMTIFYSGGALGLATSQLIFSSAYEAYGGSTFFLALPTLLLICLIGYLGLAEPTNIQPSGSIGKNLKIFGRFFRNKDLRSLYFTQLFNQSIWWAMIFLLPDLLVYREYSPWVALGGGHLFMILGCAFMSIPAGWFADRFSPRQVILYAHFAGIVLFYGILISPLLPATLLCSLLFFLGAAVGVVNPLVVAIGNHLVPSKPGMISAYLMGLVWCVSEVLGQTGGGALTTLFTEDPAGRALAVLGGFFFLGVWVTLKLPKELTNEEKWEFAL